MWRNRKFRESYKVLCAEGGTCVQPNFLIMTEDKLLKVGKIKS
jgi:ABC-type hemin transport system substrate-binding protein